MKYFAIFALFAIGACAQPPAVHAVYILPMAGGLDQYLAEQLARGHVMQVVADPKLADAVMTDHLGDAFEQRMAKIYPPESEKSGNKDENDVRPAFRSSSSRGTIFLVDAKTRQVLWSAYEKPVSSRTPPALNRHAEKIVKKLTSSAEPRPN